MNSKAEEICRQVENAIKGKHDIVLKVLTAITAGGHILLEDLPGVGKTTLAKAFSKAMSLDHKRIQFTPDTLPGDITGFSIYDKKSGGFVFNRGAVFTNLLLADEINRTSPKTQAALLETMEEKTVTVDGTTYDLTPPFIVIATENPYGSSGTQMLPMSELDRFMISLSLGYPDHDDAVSILKDDSLHPLDEITPVVSKEELLLMQKEAENVYVNDEIYEYIVSLSEATRRSSVFSAGVSPRGSIALLKMARASAYLDGRDYATDEDVQRNTVCVFSHRVILSSQAKAKGADIDEEIQKLIRDPA